LVSYKSAQNGNFFFALSRDVGTVHVQCASDALCRCESGTESSSGITSALLGIVVFVVALGLLICQTSGGNDDEQVRCGSSAA